MATTCTKTFGMLLDKCCLACHVHDPYAVAIVDRARGVIVGHVPRAISSVCYLFLGKSGTILCQVTPTTYSRINLSWHCANPRKFSPSVYEHLAKHIAERIMCSDMMSDW